MLRRRGRGGAATRWNNTHGSHHAAIEVLSDMAVKRKPPDDAPIPEGHAQGDARTGPEATPGWNIHGQPAQCADGAPT
jgi:hypothetical protein